MDEKTALLIAINAIDNLLGSTYDEASIQEFGEALEVLRSML